MTKEELLATIKPRFEAIGKQYGFEAFSMYEYTWHTPRLYLRKGNYALELEIDLFDSLALLYVVHLPDGVFPDDRFIAFYPDGKWYRKSIMTIYHEKMYPKKLQKMKLGMDRILEFMAYIDKLIFSNPQVLGEFLKSLMPEEYDNLCR